MKAIAIYLEGGGDTADGRTRLRKGMNAFLAPLRIAKGERSLRWAVIPCGPRDTTMAAFLDGEKTEPDTFNVLLVDSDDAVTRTPIDHLKDQGKKGLSAVAGDRVHLMVRIMESWIVADTKALAGFYGQGFNPNALPKAANLETVDKETVLQALAKATSTTKTKGAYHKIRHAGELLGIIGADAVRQRCKHCDRLFLALQQAIAGE